MAPARVFRLFPITVALLTLLVFLAALRNDFVNWDDVTSFLNNPGYRGLGWAQLKWMWTTHLMGRYIPITWMTLGLDYAIWEMDPFGYHLTSILFHAVNALLFYFAALAVLRAATAASSQDLRSKLPIGAFFSALVFGLHPLRVESVAWVTERRDVVCGLFFLLAILAYLRRFPDEPGQPPRRKYYWASLACFVLAILSKEIAVTLPLVLLILDVYPLRRLPGARTVWLEKLPFLAIGIADGALALYVGSRESIAASVAHVGWFSRFAISLYGLAFYLWKTVAPIHLSPFHALTAHRMDPRALPFQLSAAVVVLVTAAAWGLRRKLPALLAVWVAYTITLLPVVGIFQNGWQITADRYSYLACLGWALLAGAGLLAAFAAWGQVGKWILSLAAASAIGALGFLTWQQTQVWRSSETLWAYSLAVDPSSVAFNNLGEMFSEQGDVVTALEYYRQAVQMDPENTQAHNNLGMALLQLGDWEAAEREFQTALKQWPAFANSHFGLACALMKQGKLDEAIDHFRTALNINPGYTAARHNLEEALELKTRSPRPESPR